jgi:hypothetical protein
MRTVSSKDDKDTLAWAPGLCLQKAKHWRIVGETQQSEGWSTLAPALNGSYAWKGWWSRMQGVLLRKTGILYQEYKAHSEP